MAANTTCICAHKNSPGWSEHHLDHTQRKEEFLVEQYTQVLEALEDQYLRIGNLFMEVEKKSFEEMALGNLLHSIKEAMGQNELRLTETRRDLWEKYWEEGVAGGTKGRRDAIE